MTFSTESSSMTFLRRIGYEPLAWALRRFHTPVDPQALVLEVGAGGNPYPRANVLLDAYETTRERHWVPLATDRPTVLGFVENLPFKDHAFDFVIAAHVLEHSADPERFLTELQRVAKAGYIEVPDAFMERINPYMDHRLEITCRNKKLVIRKKISWKHDPEVIELYEDRVKPVLTGYLIPSHPFEFHVRYYWKNRISYEVVNPDVDAGWPAPVVDRAAPPMTASGRVRQMTRDFLRGLLSQRSRNASIDLLPLLRCTSCHATDLSREPHAIHCVSCGTSFPVRKSFVAMNEGQKGTS
jgi:SAM-dependent methyltransferase